MLSRTIFYLLRRLFHRLDVRGKNCFKVFLMVSKSIAYSSQTSIIFSFDSCIIGKVYNDGLNTLFIVPYHCVKSVRIWCYSGPYFPPFWLNTERYGASLRIQSGYGKIRTPNTDTFYRLFMQCILKEVTQSIKIRKTWGPIHIFKKVWIQSFFKMFWTFLAGWEGAQSSIKVR